MKLYLVQHGLAVDKTIDPDRPLSDKGQQQVQAMAAWLQRSSINIDQIYHSGKTRAQQTAELYASKLKVASVQSAEGIKPNDDVSSMAKTIDKLDTDTMIVGHLPFMQRMVSWLLTGNEEMDCHYLPGSVVCLNDENGWSLEWMLRPDIIDN